MADPVSIAGSVAGILTAGVRVSVQLYALAEKVATAEDRVRSIADDITSTCAIFNQIRELIIPQADENAILRSVFTQPGLVTVLHALQSCRTIFAEIAKLLNSAFQQVEDPSTQRSRIKLSTRECAKWPFLQPQFDEIRSDIRDSKGNPVLLVALASLRHVIRDGQQHSVHDRERLDLGSTIVQLQRARIGDEAEIALSNNKKRFRNVKNIF